MRILFLGPLPEPLTGHSLACQVLLNRLQEDHEVDVVNLSKPELTSGFSSLGRARQVLSILRRTAVLAGETDASYLTISESIAGNAKDVLIYALLFRRLRHLVLHLHGGTIRKEIFDRHPVLRAINAFFIKRVGAIIILGDTHRLIFAGMIDPTRIHVVRNFAEDEVFAEAGVVAEKHDARKDQIRVLFLSNLVSGKGHEVLFDAYASLEDAVRKRIFLDFAGSFENEADGQRFLQRMSAFDRVRYHGPVRGAGKKNLLAAADVFCLPTSLSEGQPISILEGYANGCAVITTNCGGIPDIFKHEVNGYAVEPCSVSSLAAALKRAVEEKERLKEFGLRNYSTALGKYRAKEYADRVTKIIDSVAQKTAGASTRTQDVRPC